MTVEPNRHERWHLSFDALQIGNRIWNFDINCRIYPPRNSRPNFGGPSPIYEKHFREFTIIGETKFCWLAVRDASWSHERATKVNKKSLQSANTGGANTDTQWFTDATKHVAVWLQANRLPLANAISNCKNIHILKQVAHLLEYQEVTPE